MPRPISKKLTALFIGAMTATVALPVRAQTRTVSETNDFVASRGAFLATSLGTAPLQVLNMVTPSFSIGYKSEHVMTSVGLVLSLQYAQTTSTPMAYDAKTQYREFVDGWVMIRPTLQVSFTQWEKSRLELIGQFSAGLGYLPAADVGIFELYVAPGLRGWPHRSFAVGGTLGANAMLGADFPISPRLEIQFLVLL